MDGTITSTTRELQVVRLGILSWAHFMNDGCINYLPGILPLLLEHLKAPLSLASAAGRGREASQTGRLGREPAQGTGVSWR
ncbi:MAG: hypothetical protein ACP5VF_05665 [Acidobacteriota bacterium]